MGPRGDAAAPPALTHLAEKAKWSRGQPGRGALKLTATYDDKSFQESIIAIYRFELCFSVVTVCTYLARTYALSHADNFLTQMRGQLFGCLSIQNDPRPEVLR